MPLTNLLGSGEGQGFYQLMKQLPWERLLIAIQALGAIDYALDWTMDSIWARIQDLAGDLRTSLSSVPGVKVRDLGVVQCGIVTFTVEDADLQQIKEKLAERHINVTVSQTPSTRIDMEARGLNAVIRASVHYYNSEEEVERFVETLESII